MCIIYKSYFMSLTYMKKSHFDSLIVQSPSKASDCFIREASIKG